MVARSIRIAAGVTAALAVTTACSSSGPVRSAVPVAPPAVTETAAFQGRVLTLDRLLHAGLASSELPAGFRFTTETGHRDWQAPQPDQAAPTPDGVCRPLADLLFGTTKADAEAVAGWQGPDLVDTGSIQLATYPAGRAVAFFASVKQAVQNCKQLGYKSQVGMMNGSFQLLPKAPGVGDDSISFGMIINGDNPHMVGYQYVLIGSGTVLISNISGSGNTAPPPMPAELLAAQVTKLRNAQS